MSDAAAATASGHARRPSLPLITSVAEVVPSYASAPITSYSSSPSLSLISSSPAVPVDAFSVAHNGNFKS